MLDCGVKRTVVKEGVLELGKKVVGSVWNMIFKSVGYEGGDNDLYSKLGGSYSEVCTVMYSVKNALKLL